MKYKNAKDCCIGTAVILSVVFLGGLSTASAQELTDSATVPAGLPEAPIFVTSPPALLALEQAPLVGSPVIRVYKDSNAWFGENRDNATLLSLGKVLGTDYFIHPTSDCKDPAGIPAGTDVVFFSSNGNGIFASAVNQNDAVCQRNLENFLADGGTLIVDMGDNLGSGGYIAPGSTGTPSLILAGPPCPDATLAAGALGPDGVLGTDDDHPLVKGPDGIAGTEDDLNNSNIDMASSCYIAHGNLVDGITLPSVDFPFETTLLMTASFGGIQKPILAEYCVGAGRVIVDTITKEFITHQPISPTNGPTFFMTNLFSYVFSGQANCRIPVAVDIKPQSCPNPLNCKAQGVLPVAIAGTAELDVTQIDPLTVRLAGVPALRSDLEDVTTPFEPFIDKGDCDLDCNELGPDGFTDLTLKFNLQEVVAALGDAAQDGACVVVELTGNLRESAGGTPIFGEDVVSIVCKGGGPQ